MRFELDSKHLEIAINYLEEKATSKCIDEQTEAFSLQYAADTLRELVGIIGEEICLVEVDDD